MSSDNRTVRVRYRPKKRLKGDGTRRNQVNIAKLLGRFPSELEAVGAADKAVEFKSGNNIVNKILSWLKISLYIKDLTPPITARDYAEMLAHLQLESEEQQEAIERAKEEQNG
jgi:hypothetical protein